MGAMIRVPDPKQEMRLWLNILPVMLSEARAMGGLSVDMLANPPKADKPPSSGGRRFALYLLRPVWSDYLASASKTSIIRTSSLARLSPSLTASARKRSACSPRSATVAIAAETALVRPVGRSGRSAWGLAT